MPVLIDASASHRLAVASAGAPASLDTSARAPSGAADAVSSAARARGCAARSGSAPVRSTASPGLPRGGRAHHQHQRGPVMNGT
jgi:hypothetical protein